MIDMSFNNFTVTQLFGISDYRVDVLPSVNITSKNVPSRSGTIFQGSQIGERNIEVDIYLIQDYITQFTEEGIPVASVYQNYVRSIAYYLQTDEPKKLLFSDEPNRYYNAICTGIQMDRLLQVGQGTITFLCNDPYMYATQENVFLRNETDGLWHIDNKGTAPAYPRVKVDVMSSETTYLGIVTPEGVVQIGTIAKENQVNTTKKYSDNLKTMNNWYYGSQATMSRDCEYDPDVTVTCTGEVMKPALKQYDENDKPQAPYGFKGTQLITDLPYDVHSKYFKARLQFDFFSTNANVRDPAQCGAIQMHLLDINNNQIACMGFNDHDTVAELTNMYMKLGYEDVVQSEPKLPTPTTKRYVKVFDNEEQLPADAKLVSQYERTKSYATATIAYRTVIIYNTYKAGRKKKYTFSNKEGTKLRVKTYNEEKYGNWIEVYLNSACTSSGWVYKTNVTYNEPETENVYVYERKIYPDKNIGSYTDFWGYFMVTRKPHSNGKGDIWVLELYRLNTPDGNAKRIFSKQLSDSTGTKYTHAGKLAKVAVSFVSRRDNKPISRMSFNYVSVETINDYSEEVEPHIIATGGDIIEVDYETPDVLLNGESILNEVDIGSRFAPLQPMMQSELNIVTDGVINAEVYLREKFL